jgi:hypothetical protein
MPIKCDICSIEYKTINALLRHNATYHNDNIMEKNLMIQNSNTKRKYFCTKCNKPYASRQSKWKHEQTCNNESSFVALTEQVKQMSNELKELKTMSNEIQELKNKPSVINNYTTNNTLNNKKIVINASPGTESISHLSVNQQRLIMNKGLQSLIYLIKMTNFDKNTPENHSYCVTALNDKHASVIDTKTNAIIKTDKTELFDKVLIGNIKKLETMAENKDFGLNERSNYRQKLEELKNILFRSKRGTKVYYNELNLLSYNNKDLVYDTWASLKSLDEIINAEENHKNISCDNYKPTKMTIKDYVNDASDSELSDMSDSDSDTEIDEIIIKGKHYIIEDTFVYVKNTDNTKGEVYGKYSNGKVIKLHQQPKDIEV